MPRPKKDSLEQSRQAFDALKPLPLNYGLRVSDHYPKIDLDKLYRAVAGRVEYEAGLKALTAICEMYAHKPKAKPRRPRQPSAARLAA